ncbi:MAG: NADH-quinone oxidoreductase subunit L [Chloroflexi bacterium]|nr:NADH-quinone oxidoreductase subunit L [Chloroflexota bacterium]
MIATQLIWFIFLLPLISFLIIGLIIKPFFSNQRKLSGYVAIAGIAGSLILAVWTLFSVLSSEHHEIVVTPIKWLVIPGVIDIHLGLIVNPLTVIVLIAVTVVACMVQIYSQGYMHGDKSYIRYFAFISLFTMSMIGLVMFDNLFTMFIFWELMGLCSFLLIGFWVQKPSACKAAKKAFIVTRLGDVGFLAAILFLFSKTGTLDITELSHMAEIGTITGAALTLASLGIFMGAVGKSAQFPLHIWLPDAMEGPTPVSALIHSATMVSAGVFLVARAYPLFTETSLLVVGTVGAITCIFAASMGLVMTDIKRVLAFSTISQLGYMMLGLGVGGVALGIFHLFTHAFFKGLLFLGSGSVNHATNTFDMRKMGGLRKVMPWTFFPFLAATISMAGIWPFAGFWSKDEIVAESYSVGHYVLFALAIITVFMTSFYMFRVVFLTFYGKYRGEHHPHESPKVMVYPMVVLGIFAIIAGLFNVTGGLGRLIGEHSEAIEAGPSFIGGLFGVFGHPMTWISLVVSGAGILMAYAVYEANWLSAEKIRSKFALIHKVLDRKYWMDELYENIIAGKLLLKGAFAGFALFDGRIIDRGINSWIVENLIVKQLFAALKVFDLRGIDGSVNGIADGTMASGKTLRRIQTGKLQVYLLFTIVGIIAIILLTNWLL